MFRVNYTQSGIQSAQYKMNSLFQLLFAVLISTLIGNGSASSLYYYYTGQDLNCSFRATETVKRPFLLLVNPFLGLIQNEYCKNKDGIVIKIDGNNGNETDCSQKDMRTLEMKGELINLP